MSSPEVKPEIRLEIGHVLFVDIVGYLTFAHGYGEADQAFAWLDKAVQYHGGGLSGIVTENLFDKIHADPRRLPFLSKIGKAPDRLAKIKFKVALPRSHNE